MPEELFVSVDVGTSSIKVFLFNQSGMIVRGYTEPVNIIRVPEISGVEQALGEVRLRVFEGVKHVVRGFEERVAGITLSSYGYSLACLDNNFNPLTNVMVYLDARAVKEQELLEGYGTELYRRTGCPPLYIYPIARLLWLKSKDILTGATRVSFIKDYIAYLLSRSWYVDLGTASTTGLLNTHSLTWDDLALSIVGIDEHSLPELIDGAKVLDYVSIPEVGLGKIALSLGSMDGLLQNLAYSLYGGEAAMNLGTSAAIRVLTRDVVLDRSDSMRLYHYYVADGYRATGAIFNNGMSALEWFKDLVNAGDWATVSRLVGDTPSCNEGVYVLPFVLGETMPFRDPYIRFSVLGLTLGKGLGTLVRAAFEGLAFLFAETVEALDENGVRFSDVHCGGGGCMLNPLVSIISSAICRPITVYSEEVSRAASALGALATLLRALAYARDLSMVRFDVVKDSRIGVVMPSPEACAAYSSCRRNYVRAVRSLSELYRHMVATSQQAVHIGPYSYH